VAPFSNLIFHILNFSDHFSPRVTCCQLWHRIQSSRLEARGPSILDRMGRSDSFADEEYVQFFAIIFYLRRSRKGAVLKGAIDRFVVISYFDGSRD
jgi:hypothetical protein